jgi:hypothetical protein
VRETVPSMQPNELLFETDTGPEIIVDYPGHVSQSLGLAALLEKAKRVFFVIDSSDASSLISSAK